MPLRALRPCRKPGCPGFSRDGYCDKHQGEKKSYFASLRAMDKTRPSARARGYDTRWAKYSKARLARFPLCAACERQGKVVLATCTDHMKPHRGDLGTFWDESNHQSLCSACNARKAAREGAERRSALRAQAQGGGKSR